MSLLECECLYFWGIEGCHHVHLDRIGLPASQPSWKAHAKRCRWEFTSLSPWKLKQGGQGSTVRLLAEHREPHRVPVGGKGSRWGVSSGSIPFPHGALLKAGDLGDVPAIFGDHPLAQHGVILLRLLDEFRRLVHPDVVHDHGVVVGIPVHDVVHEGGVKRLRSFHRNVTRGGIWWIGVN